MYLVSKDGEERVRAGRVGDVPDQKGHGLVMLHPPLREELGHHGRRKDVVTFIFSSTTMYARTAVQQYIYDI